MLMLSSTCKIKKWTDQSQAADMQCTAVPVAYVDHKNARKVGYTLEPIDLLLLCMLEYAHC
jgi:hypothetical protein